MRTTSNRLAAASTRRRIPAWTPGLNVRMSQRSTFNTSSSATTPRPSPPRAKKPSGSATRSPRPVQRTRKGSAEEVGRDLAERALAMRAGSRRSWGGSSTAAPTRLPTCFVSGGEPVVKLVESSRRGLGGRNQQLVLAALLRLFDDGAEGIALLSGGTDGEDGPTDAAGAFLDADVLAAARERISIRPIISPGTTPITSSSRSAR